MANTSKLWTAGFIKICISNLLVYMSLYMLLPVFPSYLVEKFGISYFTAGWVLALYALSLFILGPFFNYLVDVYRRRTICVISLLFVAAALAGYSMVAGMIWIVALRIVQGMFSGVAMMSLGSTLAIDITPSTRRSDANTSVARCGRIGMAFGPMVGLLVVKYYGINMAFMASALVAVAAILLILTISVAFRAPICSSVCSTDRFILPRGWLLALNLVLITSVLGITLVAVDSYIFYLLMAIGVVIGMVANSLVFAEADVRARIISGLVLMGAALLLLTTHEEELAFNTAALLLGTGLGLASFHFLLMLIKVSEHCQRGTANTTYAFAWEVGVGLGMLIGCGLTDSYTKPDLFHAGVWITVLALIIYIAFTNTYFFKHKRK